MNPFVAISLIVNSALYSTLVFGAGLYIHNGIAVLGSIVTVGLCYLCAFVQLNFPEARKITLALVGLSIASGIASAVPLVLR